MDENGCEIRRIAWSDAFPFVRLFRTMRLALGFNRLVLGFLCVLCIYIGGRVLDRLWLATGGGVAVQGVGNWVTTEVAAYARSPQREFDKWLREAERTREETAVNALMDSEAGLTPKSARAKLTEHNGSLAAILDTAEHRADVDWARAYIEQRVGAGREAIAGDEERNANERGKAQQQLTASADVLRAMLATGDARYSESELSAAMRVVLFADPGADGAQSDDRARLGKVLMRQMYLARYAALEPIGPFAALLRHEMHCFAAAIQGVCHGRWGYAGQAYDNEPSLIGSIASAWRGVAWLGLRRTCYTCFYGVFHLLVFALFGGAICRSAAVETARDETIGIGESLSFAQEKYSGLVMAPLLPLLVFILAGICVGVGGMVGAIPWLGELVGGVFFFLALLGGFVAAIVLLATVLGFNLMWPTIGAEGSDGFDALSRACSYVGSRIFHYGFYSLALLVYGAIAFVLVRLIAMLTLKLTHSFAGEAMNEWASNGMLESIGKLDGMWLMPAWADLSLLPSTGPMPFWGSLFNAPLGFTETIGAFFIAVYVFSIVGLVGGFVVSFFFSGSTQMYFLLRQDVDATDWSEVYYEEPEEDLPYVGDTDADAGAEAAESDGETPPGESPAPENDEAPPAS